MAKLLHVQVEMDCSRPFILSEDDKKNSDAEDISPYSIATSEITVGLRSNHIIKLNLKSF